MNTVQRFKLKRIVKALLGTLLKKGWDWLQNTTLSAAVAESPAVMTASGWRINKNGLAKQDLQNNKGVKLLRNNLATIGEAGITTPTMVGDIEGLYNVVRHPVLTYNMIKLAAKEIPLLALLYMNSWKTWVEKMLPKLTNNSYNSEKLISIGNASKNKALDYYKSLEFIGRAKKAGFNNSEISQLLDELQDMLTHSLIRSSNSYNNGVHAWADAYLDKSGNLYRNATSFEPNVQGFSLEDIIGMWDHEFGHVATNMYNSAGMNLGNFMLQIESRYPMIVKMMKYNESIAPKFKPEIENLYKFWNSPDIKYKLKTKYPLLSDSELNLFINKYLNFSKQLKEYIGNSNELRSRALATLFAAQRKGKSAYQYTLENAEDLNAARELDNIFEKHSLKKYMDNFLNYGVPTISVAGTSYVGATK